MFLHGDLLHLFGNMVFSWSLQASGKSGLKNKFPGFVLDNRAYRRAGSHAHATEPLTSYRRQWSHQRFLGAFFICNPRARITLFWNRSSFISCAYLRSASSPDLPACLVLSTDFFCSKTTPYECSVLGSCGRICAGVIIAVAVRSHPEKRMKP
jgi:hypothetical protein